jgi:hypothetical protein
MVQIAVVSVNASIETCVDKFFLLVTVIVQIAVTNLMKDGICTIWMKIHEITIYGTFKLYILTAIWLEFTVEIPVIMVSLTY